MHSKFVKMPFRGFINQNEQAVICTRVRMAVALLGMWYFFCPQTVLADNSGIEPVDASLGTAVAPTPSAASSTEPESWNVHGQFTNVTQWHDSFNAPYSGANSLAPRRNHADTNDLTLFAGVRLWQGGELYLNPEVDEGFGLDNTLGLAGFSSGEAYKVGKPYPYLRLPRAFFRQVIDLGGESKKMESAANQLAGSKSADNITLTVGKFSVVDIFDTNVYAHDPRGDFMNWSIVESGAFDYAADSWGYTDGAAVEWTQSWWTLRGGLFALSKTPNSEHLQQDFSQYSIVGEVEERHQWFGHNGKLKLLGFIDRGRMASYDDAVHLAQQNGGTPDPVQVRRFSSRPGMAVNLEQELTSDLGLFARASVNDGSKEAYDFTDINQSVSAGLSLSGNRWGRQDDTIGVAMVVNGISNAARRYFAAGGLGILIGDGQLPHYGTERILETYYSLHLNQYIKLSADYQYIVNPAYNSDRGPVSIFGFRAHAEF